jgi:hypothetical protein
MKGSAVLAVVLPLVVAFGLGASVGVSHVLGYEGWFGLGRRPAPAPAASPLDRLESDLGLRAEQKEEFEGFRSYCECGFGGGKGRLATARAELGKAILAEPADPERIERARRELLAAYDESQKDMVDRLLALKGKLDPEQKKKMADAFFPGCGCDTGSGCGKCGGCRGGR